MEADEAGTIARLRTHRIELIDPAIAKNEGRIIKTTGDGMLVEFQSVTDAVKCAVEIQQRMKRRNSDVPQYRRIEFRIGINLGDIIFDDDDIFGDGVNIAARIEQLADVGGICVTAAVATQIADRLEVPIEDLGEKMLKKKKKGAKRAVSKPAIVVLPFDNMSGDPEQDFFADGLTEDIITELSRRHELFVISRNSSFVYKNQAVNVREVAEKLGAQYLVEGSVRKIGDRVRVTVQLIDAVNDAHVWADKYDRRLDDIFAIQDEVTAAIAATLPGRLAASQRDQLARIKPADMAAYECALTAKVLHHRIGIVIAGFVIASSKHTDRNESLRASGKSKSRPIVKMSRLGRSYPPEKQVAIDPAPTRRLRNEFPGSCAPSTIRYLPSIDQIR
ncbi:hypothetical protein ILFOPFJJ_05872 [Ensifer psoraleae]|nr:hypothetical protein [Sinorhizobium psoraleae]